MPDDRHRSAGEIEENSARIAVAERTQRSLRDLLSELDQADFPLAAIHVNAAVEQLEFDMASIRAVDH